MELYVWKSSSIYCAALTFGFAPIATLRIKILTNFCARVGANASGTRHSLCLVVFNSRQQCSRTFSPLCIVFLKTFMRFRMETSYMVAQSAKHSLASDRSLILREGFRSYKGNLYKRFTVNKHKQRMRRDFAKISREIRTAKPHVPAACLTAARGISRERTQKIPQARLYAAQPEG